MAAAQVPSASPVWAWMQAEQPSLQALLQQTWSTQKPLLHDEAVVHGAPAGRSVGGVASTAPARVDYTRRCRPAQHTARV